MIKFHLNCTHPLGSFSWQHREAGSNLVKRNSPREPGIKFTALMRCQMCHLSSNVKIRESNRSRTKSKALSIYTCIGITEKLGLHGIGLPSRLRIHTYDPKQSARYGRHGRRKVSNSIATSCPELLGNSPSARHHCCSVEILNVTRHSLWGVLMGSNGRAGTDRQEPGLQNHVAGLIGASNIMLIRLVLSGT